MAWYSSYSIDTSLRDTNKLDNNRVSTNHCLKGKKIQKKIRLQQTGQQQPGIWPKKLTIRPQKKKNLVSHYLPGHLKTPVVPNDSPSFFYIWQEYLKHLKLTGSFQQTLGFGQADSVFLYVVTFVFQKKKKKSLVTWSFFKDFVMRNTFFFAA